MKPDKGLAWPANHLISSPPHPMRAHTHNGTVHSTVSVATAQMQLMQLFYCLIPTPSLDDIFSGFRAIAEGNLPLSVIYHSTVAKFQHYCALIGLANITAPQFELPQVLCFIYAK